MAFIPSAPLPPEPQPELFDTLPDARPIVPQVPSNPEVAKLLSFPQLGEYRREMLTWRTPNLGYVKMYLNPQSIRIQDRKIISSDRTKGGYVIQYAGEALTEISIEGTTGSGGIEGINILRSIYRSEQEAFEGIAVGLDETLANIQLDTLATNTLDQLNPFDFNVFSVANDVFRNFGRPQPTLASLAANIELYFQGEVYRGYFESFSVSERATEPGWFDYTIMFKAYARQGKRHNFMPWHRQPINPADVKSNPLSFTGASDVANVLLNPPPLSSNSKDGTNNSVPNLESPASTMNEIKLNKRNLRTAAGLNGQNIRDGNL